MTTLNKIVNCLDEKFSKYSIKATLDERNIARLEGVCKTWQEVVDIGHAIGKMEDVYSVVNHITVEGVDLPKKDYTEFIAKGKEIGVIKSVDAVVVGGGVVGCGIARELAKYNLKVILCEKDEDVANGATKANNGDIHSGYLEKPGTLKAKLNVEGNAMYDEWAKELNFDLHRLGNLLVVNSENFLGELDYAKAQADKNGVPCRYVSQKEILEMEPLAKTADTLPYAGLYVPSMANVDPWEVAIALAENAIENGVEVMLDCNVCDVETAQGNIKAVITEKGIIETKYIFNCAGVYADEISKMAGDECFTIHPRKGAIAIMDKSIPSYNRPYRIVDEDRPLRSTSNSKGGGMATTVAGNNLLGPSATETPDKEDLDSIPTDLEFAMMRNSIKQVSKKGVIRYFVGSRPATYTEDFFIEMSPIAKGLINVAGTQSPGLASAPAIAKLAINILKEHLAKNGEAITLKDDFNPNRKAHIKFTSLSREQQDALIKEKPEYGRIICRCETITEGEILEVIHSPLIPTSVDAIKRRTRAGMGRCQGGFCQPRVVELLARELGVEMTKIQLKERGSDILVQDNRPDER